MVRFGWPLPAKYGELSGDNLLLASGIDHDARSLKPTLPDFPDGQSASMLVAARLRHIAGSRWGTRAYLNMELLKEISQREEMAA